MRVVMLSTDRTILEARSRAAERMAEYGTLFDSLTVLVAGTGEARRLSLGTNVTVVYPGGRSRVLNFFRLLYATRVVESDVVSAQDPTWTGLIAILSLKRPVQIQVHTDTWHGVAALLVPFVLRRATCVRVVSEHVRARVQRYTKVPISVLPIFVDPGMFEKEFPKPPEYREGSRLLVVSRFAREKRLDLVLQALVRVPRVHLYLVGDGPLRSSLESRVKSLELGGRVHFLGWQHETAPYFAHADCYISTSAFEGYGMSLMEAALAGCPIVSTNVGVARELPAEIVTVVEPNEYRLVDAITASLTTERKQGAGAASRALRARMPSRAAYLARYRELIATCAA